MSHEPRVIARSRAYLQDTVARPQFELLQHYGHDGWLGGGAYDLPVNALGENRVVAIDSFWSDVRQEQVAWDSPECSFNAGGTNAALAFKVLYKCVVEPVDSAGI